MQVIKQENYTEQHPSYEQQAVNQQDVNLRDELKPLWVACYFERRLSKVQVQAVDLKHTMRVLEELMAENAADFRRVYPFVFGLIKILLRKMTFLISESNSTLESLKNPFASEDLEDVTPAGETKRRQAQANKRDGAYQAPQQNKIKRNFIDLSNVQYHGLDKRVFEKIEEAMKLDFLAMQERRQKDEFVN